MPALDLLSDGEGALVGVGDDTSGDEGLGDEGLGDEGFGGGDGVADPVTRFWLTPMMEGFGKSEAVGESGLLLGSG